MDIQRPALGEIISYGSANSPVSDEEHSDSKNQDQKSISNKKRVVKARSKDIENQEEILESIRSLQVMSSELIKNKALSMEFITVFVEEIIQKNTSLVH
jgi:hypothetical protein